MRLIAASIVTLAFVVATTPARAQTGGTCDRACLIKTADSYFAAMAAHDPKKASMAPTVRFTEQAKVLKVGEGLWKSMTEGPRTFKIYVPDPVSQQIGGIAMIKSEGKPVELALRLKVRNRQIVEAEHLMATITADSQLANLQMPRSGLLSPVPASDRLPREILLLFAHGYYDALEQSDGHAVPFADDCVRRENGMQTAGPRPAGAPATPARGAAPVGTQPAPAGGRAGGAPAATPRPGANGGGRDNGGDEIGGRALTLADIPGSQRGGGLPGATGPAQLCGPQLDTRRMSYIDSLDLRRVMIADPENGLVFGLSMFRHSMPGNPITVVEPDGSKSQQTMPFKDPFDLEAAHIIKVQGNKIHDIEAMGYMLPLYSKNGWSEFLR
jgi:hypothetical protein